MWPERTDPHKFVYEDVAIATYLLVSGNIKSFIHQNFICVKYLGNSMQKYDTHSLAIVERK